MKGLRSMRPLPKESIRGLEPAKIVGKMPKVEMIDPRTLFIEEDYQRSILSNGTRLIRKIYSDFNWSRFKPPICVRVGSSGGALVCIDGQHTATACATLGIWKIPVMIVSADSVRDRARAFVGHNRERLSLTTQMIFAAELAAGDPTAVTIDEACKEAGATIPRRAISTSAKENHTIGTTVSIGAIRAIAKRQGKESLVRVLKLLVHAKRGPIKAVEITAAAIILADHGEQIDRKLRDVIASKTVEQWTAAGHTESVETGKAIAICVACAWCRALGIDEPNLKLRGNPTDHARVITKPSVTPAPPVVSTVLEVPAKSEMPMTPPNGTITIVERDGMRLDLMKRRLSKNGSVIELNEPETLALRALIQVAPAVLPYDRIATKVWNKRRADERYELLQIITPLQPRLNALGLRVREASKMGFAIGTDA